MAETPFVKRDERKKLLLAGWWYLSSKFVCLLTPSAGKTPYYLLSALPRLAGAQR